MTDKSGNRLRQVLVSITLILVSITLITLASVTLSGAALSSDKSQTRSRANSAAKARPIELRDVAQLKTVFQRDDDKVRVVVLVSPT